MTCRLQPKVKKLSVDGSLLGRRHALIEAWASMKSVKPKDGSGEPPAEGGGRYTEADFHGEKRSNETHASTACHSRLVGPNLNPN